MHAQNLFVYFKLKSVCIIQNTNFQFLLLLKITIILCSSKCTLFRMRKKIQNDATYYTGKQKSLFSKRTHIYTLSGAEWCPKHDIAFRFSLN